MELYADIILPLSPGVFSYRVGEAIAGDVAPGRCVEVALGRKLYAGMVLKTYTDKPPFRTIRTIDRYVTGAPVISGVQLHLWQWIADYYMCGMGDVMRVALPAALKPKGFSAEQFAGATYRPLTALMISLHPGLEAEKTLDETFETLRKRAPKQYGALLEIVEKLEREPSRELRRESLEADIVILRQLEKKNLINITRKELSAGELPPLPEKLPSLSPAQKEALASIEAQSETKDVTLLHGVTGSGKTEIYLHLIKKELASGRNVLYLLPEIAMTTQLVQRIKAWFGDRVITYHSSFPERRRVENYLRASRSEGGELILGVRSSLFLPTGNLGLVIVDEEHDTSYKNSDSAPRYNARDCAAVLARLCGAHMVLGTATPSLESYANAIGGKYGYVRLSQKYGGALPQNVVISDTIAAVKRGERRAHFNKVLLDNISQTLTEGGQTILFQNRRGFSPYVECPDCGYAVPCPRCNVTLTLHKAEGKLRCHYCGHAATPPPVCPSCGKGTPQPMGFGTEKVEEELAALFPSARIARLDRDTVHSVKGYESLIGAFARRQIDILVGTQMITKGFDFEGVSLVGILNADNLLAYPDFRAAERAFQTITQVAGRAGRRAQQGTVVIQTAQPANPVIRQAATGDYQSMAQEQLSERVEFFFPPYCRLISITMRHRDAPLLWSAAEMVGEAARRVFGSRLTGPVPPAVDRIRGEHIVTFLLKIERERPAAEAKRKLREILDTTLSGEKYRRITVVCDVDPQ